MGKDTGEWGGRESVDRHEWEGRRRAATDRGSGVGGEIVEIDKRRSGVGRGESGDRQGVCSGEGTVWGVWGSGVGVEGVVREEEDWEERGQDEGQSRKGGEGG